MVERKVSSSLLERKRFLFWRKVNKNGPIPEHVPGIGNCWVWTGGTLSRGYGSFRGLDQKTTNTHRFSWLLEYGEIPEGLLVLHKCDNVSCVRPDHLFLGTYLDNSLDMVAKGRCAMGGFCKQPIRRGERSPTAMLTNADVATIRALYAAGGITHQQLADKYGISRPHVTGIITGAQRKTG